MLSAAPRTAGTYTEVWDGLDRYGNAAPVGNYTWKLLENQRLKTEIVTQVGSTINPIGSVGTGNHKGTQAMESDSTGLYSVAESEGGFTVSKTDFNNKYIWGSAAKVGYGDKTMGLMNGKLYIMSQTKEIGATTSQQTVPRKLTGSHQVFHLRRIHFPQPSARRRIESAGFNCKKTHLKMIKKLPGSVNTGQQSLDCLIFHSMDQQEPIPS